jgi:hypothetical protein
MSIFSEIRKGMYDEDLDLMGQAIIQRRKAISQELFMDIAIGTKVVFRDTVRPTYLRGVEGTVVGKKISKLVVRLSSPVGRYRGDIRVPTSLVEVVE